MAKRGADQGCARMRADLATINTQAFAFEPSGTAGGLVAYFSSSAPQNCDYTFLLLGGVGRFAQGGFQLAPRALHLLGAAQVCAKVLVGRKRTAQMLHALADALKRGKHRIYDAAVLIQLRLAALGDVVELARAFGFDRGIADLFEVRQSGVDHAW